MTQQNCTDVTSNATRDARIESFNVITKNIANVCTPILIVVGVILNMLTVLVFCRRDLLKNYCISISMICLSVSDIFVLIVPLFGTWLDEIFFNSHYTNNTIWCNLHGYLDMIGAANSTWIVILISVERWFAVCRPFDKSIYFTSLRVISCIVCMFLVSLVCFAYFPLLLEIRKARGCEIREGYEAEFHILGIVSITLIYVWPFVLLAFLNAIILVNLYKRRPIRKRLLSRVPTIDRITDTTTNVGLTTSDHSSSGVAAALTKQTASSSSHINKNIDRNFSITLVTVALTFIVLTIPFQLNWFYVEVLGSKSSQQCNRLDFSHITFAIKNMNYVINFFLYSMLSRLFREELVAMFGFLHGCSKYCSFLKGNQATAAVQKQLPTVTEETSSGGSAGGESAQATIRLKNSRFIFKIELGKKRKKKKPAKTPQTGGEGKAINETNDNKIIDVL